MSRSFRCLDSSVRILKFAPSGSSIHAQTQTTAASRRVLISSSRSRSYGLCRSRIFSPTPFRATRLSHSTAAAVAREPEVSYSEPLAAGEPIPKFNEVNSKKISQFDDVFYASHLNDLFAPLVFPDELAKRLLTHSSHPGAFQGHNGRFGFIGRRVFEAYLLLFLHSSRSSGKVEAEINLEAIVSSVLNSYLLGEHVAPTWKLGRVLRWVPTLPQAPRLKNDLNRGRSKDNAAVEYRPDVLKSVGLFKVQGEAVQAILGGIYHQFGASVAQRVFHTRLLPHILLPGTSYGLNDSFHAHALRMCDELGGPGGDILLGTQIASSPPGLDSTSIDTLVT